VEKREHGIDTAVVAGTGTNRPLEATARLTTFSEGRSRIAGD